MAFNFLGTFSETEIAGLLDFAEDQLEDIQDRISYLRSCIEKNGWITFERDEDGRTISYEVTPSNSVLSKYIRSYQFWGGNLLELPILSRGEWLSLSQGEPSMDSQQQFQGGRIQGSDDYYAPNVHKDDMVESATVAKVKDWMIPAIQTKREHWEFKIKKSIDLVDQYLEEIILLVQRSTGVDTIEDLRSQINYYLNSDEFIGAGQGHRNNNGN